MEIPVLHDVLAQLPKFDYIFFDPPFPYKYHEDLIKKADEAKILKETGTIMVHRPEEHFMPDTIGNLTRYDQRVYGRSIVDFYGYGKKS